MNIVYLIENKINGKKYIGQTKDYNTRMRFHKKCYGYPSNKMKVEKGYINKIDEDIYILGESNFDFTILKENLTQDESDYYEEYYINNLKTIEPNGYNKKLGGFNGGKNTYSINKKISESQIGSKNHMFNIKGKKHHSSKRVKDVYNNIIFNSATEASEKLNISQSKICASARGDRVSVSGRVFCYLDCEDNPIEKVNNVDSPVRCIDLNKEWRCSADAEFELFGKINGRILRAIKTNMNVNKMKFEIIC